MQTSTLNRSFADTRRAAAERAMTPETRGRLAEYHVLSAYDLARIVRYGDMAGSRRGREINRRGDALITEGVPVNGEGGFPVVTVDELAAAWQRVAVPRIRRVESETFRSDTKYSRATLEAWRATRLRLFGVQS